MQGVPLFGGRPVQETAAFYSRYDAVQMIISAASPLPQAKNQWNLSSSSAFTSRCMAQEWPVEPIFFAFVTWSAGSCFPFVIESLMAITSATNTHPPVEPVISVRLNAVDPR